MISAPTAFEFIATYALPNALPMITFTFGTVAFAKAYVSLATAFAIRFSPHIVASYPFTFVRDNTGISKASQN